jgi:hypothetical protein
MHGVIVYVVLCNYKKSASRLAQQKKGAPSKGCGFTDLEKCEDHVWFEDQWMVASWCDE